RHTESYLSTFYVIRKTDCFKKWRDEVFSVLLSQLLETPENIMAGLFRNRPSKLKTSLFFRIMFSLAPFIERYFPKFICQGFKISDFRFPSPSRRMPRKSEILNPEQSDVAKKTTGEFPVSYRYFRFSRMCLDCLNA